MWEFVHGLVIKVFWESIVWQYHFKNYICSFKMDPNSVQTSPGCISSNVQPIIDFYDLQLLMGAWLRSSALLFVPHF